MTDKHSLYCWTRTSLLWDVSSLASEEKNHVLLRNLHNRDRTLPPNKYSTHRVQNPVDICVFLPVFCPGKHCKHHSEKICLCRFCRLEKNKTIVTFHAFIVFKASLGQADRQVVESGRKLNLSRDLRRVQTDSRKFPRKYIQVAKKQNILRQSILYLSLIR